jgi:hypothetical protein
MQANGWGRSAPGAHQQHRIGYIVGHLVKRFPPLSQIGGIPLTSFSSYAFIGSPDYLLHNTLLERDGSEDQLALTPPFLVNRPQASNTTPVLTPEDGFPANFLSSSDINFNAAVVPNSRTGDERQRALCAQYSTGIQHSFYGDWTAEVDYVGTKSTHLDVIRNSSQPLISGNHSAGVVPYSMSSPQFNFPAALSSTTSENTAVSFVVGWCEQNPMPT